MPCLVRIECFIFRKDIFLRIRREEETPLTHSLICFVREELNIRQTEVGCQQPDSILPHLLDLIVSKSSIMNTSFVSHSACHFPATNFPLNYLFLILICPASSSIPYGDNIFTGIRCCLADMSVFHNTWLLLLGCSLYLWPLCQGTGILVQQQLSDLPEEAH